MPAWDQYLPPCGPRPDLGQMWSTVFLVYVASIKKICLPFGKSMHLMDCSKCNNHCIFCAHCEENVSTCSKFKIAPADASTLRTENFKWLQFPALIMAENQVKSTLLGCLVNQFYPHSGTGRVQFLSQMPVCTVLLHKRKATSRAQNNLKVQHSAKVMENSCGDLTSNYCWKSHSLSPDKAIINSSTSLHEQLNYCAMMGNDLPSNWTRLTSALFSCYCKKYNFA